MKNEAEIDTVNGPLFTVDTVVDKDGDLPVEIGMEELFLPPSGVDQLHEVLTDVIEARNPKPADSVSPGELMEAYTKAYDAVRGDRIDDCVRAREAGCRAVAELVGAKVQ